MILLLGAPRPRREAIGRALAMAGHRVEVVSSAAEAGPVLEAGVEVVIADEHTPEPDLRAVATAVRERSAGARLIGVEGAPGVRELADHLLTRPIDLEELRRLLR